MPVYQILGMAFVPFVHLTSGKRVAFSLAATGLARVRVVNVPSCIFTGVFGLRRDQTERAVAADARAAVVVMVMLMMAVDGGRGQRVAVMLMMVMHELHETRRRLLSLRLRLRRRRQRRLRLRLLLLDRSGGQDGRSGRRYAAQAVCVADGRGYRRRRRSFHRHAKVDGSGGHGDLHRGRTCRR